MNIRLARPDDAPRLLEIYTPYVENTAVSFELVPPSLEEFRRRIENTLMRYPYLVAEEDGEIIGYAYASSFHPRAAYIHSAEASIYLDARFHRHGTGSALYAALESILLKQNIYRLYALVVCAQVYDEYLSDRSLRFHYAQGYERVGVHNDCGWKFSRWYSVMHLEKKLCPVPENPADFVPFPKLYDKSE